MLPASSPGLALPQLQSRLLQPPPALTSPGDHTHILHSVFKQPLIGGNRAIALVLVCMLSLQI